jgi:adenosine deaminase CECR1
LPLVFHAGESVDAANENLFDALLLGTKRIGHGFNLALHPHLQELVK